MTQQILYTLVVYAFACWWFRNHCIFHKWSWDFGLMLSWKRLYHHIIPQQSLVITSLNFVSKLVFLQKSYFMESFWIPIARQSPFKAIKSFTLIGFNLMPSKVGGCKVLCCWAHLLAFATSWSKFVSKTAWNILLD